jgi:hypothetical protein
MDFYSVAVPLTATVKRSAVVRAKIKNFTGRYAVLID